MEGTVGSARDHSLDECAQEIRGAIHANATKTRLVMANAEDAVRYGAAVKSLCEGLEALCRIAPAHWPEAAGG